LPHISVGRKAFETSRPEHKAFQRVKALDPKALAKYLLLLCIYEIGTIFVKTMHSSGKPGFYLIGT
jgi:hypothetical protein